MRGTRGAVPGKVALGGASAEATCQRVLNEARGPTGVQVEALSERRTARTRCGWAQWSEEGSR